ncbi:MAG: hypothetical protein KGQ41_09280 [Alphaproteobacteria bacterium]|nr:hypothetical protein [Alphaproteobacteria bacterium]
MPKNVTISAYFNRLGEVQLAVAKLMAARDLVHHHMGNGAQIVSSSMARTGRSRNEVSAFIIEAQTINDITRHKAEETLRDILREAMILDVFTSNLPSMTAMGEHPKPEGYEALGKLQNRLKREGVGIERRLVTIRKEGERALMKAAGISPESAKHVLSA